MYKHTCSVALAQLCSISKPILCLTLFLPSTWHDTQRHRWKASMALAFAENFTTPDHHKPWILMKLFPCCVYVWSRQMLAILGHFVFLAQVHEQHATSIQDKRGRKYQVCFVSTRVHWEWGLQSVDFLLGNPDGSWCITSEHVSSWRMGIILESCPNGPNGIMWELSHCSQRGGSTPPQTRGWRGEHLDFSCVLFCNQHPNKIDGISYCSICSCPCMFIFRLSAYDIINNYWWYQVCQYASSKWIDPAQDQGFWKELTSFQGHRSRNRSLPNWQTPERWCTAQGAEMMETWQSLKQIYVDLPHCSILWKSQLWNVELSKWPSKIIQNEKSRAEMGRVGSRNTPASGWHKPGFLPSPPRLFKWSLANGRTTSIHESGGISKIRDQKVYGSWDSTQRLVGWCVVASVDFVVSFMFIFMNHMKRY